MDIRLTVDARIDADHTTTRGDVELAVRDALGRNGFDVLSIDVEGL